MAGELCLDTTALIHFEAADVMSTLELLCTQDGDSCVPISVVDEWHGHTEGPAGCVEGYPWLTVVRAWQDDPPLPTFLAQGNLDGVVLATARAAMNTPAR